jgi:hypothetical protein
MPNSSFAAVVRDWEKLLTTVGANKADLPYLEEALGRLSGIVESLKTANDRQTAFRAQVQQATRDVESLLDAGREIATKVRNGLRMQYGLKGEKLVEFGLQPRRKPQSKAEKKRKPEPVVAQPVPAQKDSEAVGFQP